MVEHRPPRGVRRKAGQGTRLGLIMRYPYFLFNPISWFSLQLKPVTRNPMTVSIVMPRIPDLFVNRRYPVFARLPMSGWFRCRLPGLIVVFRDSRLGGWRLVRAMIGVINCFA